MAHRFLFVGGFLFALTLPLCLVSAADLQTPALTAADSPKVPVALAWDRDGSLLVALRDAKAITAIDPDRWQVKRTWELPIQPSSMISADDQGALLVGGVDGKLVVMGSNHSVRRTLDVGRGPTHLLRLPEKNVAVACQWDAAVRIVNWEKGSVVSTHAFPFPPGAMVPHPDGRVIVADAFGSRLADFRPGKTGSERVHEVDGVNLHALAVSGDGKELLMAHMFQFDSVSITNANIDWGLVLSAKLSSIRLSDLDVQPQSESPLPRRRLALDGSVHGAADPSAMIISPDGNEIFIALAGAHQVLNSHRTENGVNKVADGLLPLGHNQRLEVAEVGRTPVALALDQAGKFVITADAMSDTVTVLHRSGLAKAATVRLSSNKIQRTPAQRGEALFRDGRRSLDRWMSCASCHPSGHTTGLNFDTQGDGGYGAPKNTPSLFGVQKTEPFTWVGTFPRLGEQVHQSFLSSLKGRPAEPEEIADVTAYLESLSPLPPRHPRNDEVVRRGAELFQTRRCNQCHQPPLFTTNSLRDVGLNDESAGHTRFNPPSLRGVGWTAPYLHDGRCDTLNEVLEIHSPQVQEPLTPAAIEALIAYLQTL